MSRTQTMTRSKKGSRLSLEKLDQRTLLSTTTTNCALVGDVLEANFCYPYDSVQFDRNPTARTVDVTINSRAFSFQASGIHGLRITGMTGYDLVLLDTSLGLPTFLEATIGGNFLNGWVKPNSQPGLSTAHQHQSGGHTHWVIDAGTYQKGWDFLSANPGASSDQLAQLAAAVGSGISLLDGHLFHSPGAASLGLGNYAGMTSGHGSGLFADLSGMLHSQGASYHDLLSNMPFQGVDHKPG